MNSPGTKWRLTIQQLLETRDGAQGLEPREVVLAVIWGAEQLYKRAALLPAARTQPGRAGVRI
jgi:hypothetical protein